MNYSETRYGFTYGPVTIERCISDEKKGCVVLRLQTDKHRYGNDIQIYATRTGKVRIHSESGEWNPPKKITKSKSHK